MRADRTGHDPAELGDLGLGRAASTAHADAVSATDEGGPGHGGTDVLDAQVHVRGPGPGRDACMHGPAGGGVEERGEETAVHDLAAVAVLGTGIRLDQGLGVVDADVAE